MFTALTVIAILVLLIVVHELGHFIAAKLSGVKVEEFGIGYPPRAFSLGIFGGTEYTINWLPFGGFVRLFGESGDQVRGKGSLQDAPRWKQATILAAGVAMNALTAWILFTVAFHIGILQPITEPRAGEVAHVVVADVVAGSPASLVGLKPGDEILAMSDEEGRSAAEPLTPEGIVVFVRDHAGDTLGITYKSVGEERHATITPVQGVIEQQADQPALGIALALVANRSEGWGTSMKNATKETIASFRSVVDSLWALLGTAARGDPDIAGVVGPVGIVSYVDAASQNGIGAVLMLAALISVNLAIINLIPIPALDGGRLAILGIEAVTRRGAPRIAVGLLNSLGIALIILLMLVVTYHDIARLLT